jgi:chitinase
LILEPLKHVFRIANKSFYLENILYYDLIFLEDAIQKFKSGGAKVLFSIGHYDYPSNVFSEMLQSAESRHTFIADVKQYLLQFKFDGLDFFWYSPVFWKDGSELHHDDKENFQSLLEELKTSFADSALILTTEVSARPDIRNVAFDMNRLLNSVDFINLVSWDLYGPWQPETGFGNSLNGTYKGSLSLVVTFDIIPNNETI